MNKLKVIDQREVLGKPFTLYGNFENPLFLAKEVAEWIEHTDVSTMLRTVDDDEKVTNIVCTPGGNQNAWFLTEEGLYEILMQSRKPIAKQFKAEVKKLLKALRTGKVKLENPRRSLGEINSAARIISQTLKEAGMPPQYRAVAIKSLYAPVGVDIPLDGITVDKKTCDATAIAKRLGVLSKSGLPHAQAVSAIIAWVDVRDDEKVLVPFQSSTNGHSGPTWQYAESVVGRVGAWLERHGYPPEIVHNGKTFKVTYARKQTA